MRANREPYPFHHTKGKPSLIRRPVAVPGHRSTVIWRRIVTASLLAVVVVLFYHVIKGVL